MPPVVDNSIFDEPFTSVELTNAINKLPYEPDELGSQFNWTVTRSPTTSVRLNVTDGKIDIAPYVPRDGVPPVLHGVKRSAMTVEIPGLAGRASAMNREALNVTAGLTGEQRLESLEMLRDEKAKIVDMSITRGERRQVAEAIRGRLTNPAPVGGGGVEEVLDLLKVMSAEQIEVDLDLTDSKNGLNEQIEEIKEISEQALGGSALITGFKLISGKNPFNAIRASKDYKDLLTNPMHQYQAKVDGRKTVPINDNVDLVPYKHGYFAADEAYLVPIYDGHAQVVYGPHDASDFWGNVLPRYLLSFERADRRGVEMEGWAYVLRYFQHPEAILCPPSAPTAQIRGCEVRRVWASSQ